MIGGEGGGGVGVCRVPRVGRVPLGEAVGAKSIDFEVQAFRGIGGLVLDANGKQFANTLGRRVYVTGGMWKDQLAFSAWCSTRLPLMRSSGTAGTTRAAA